MVFRFPDDTAEKKILNRIYWAFEINYRDTITFLEIKGKLGRKVML